uniref:Uncharacterized protein n=1 Tax=Parascaris univalens TaxID=6257 RepID=A0A915CBC4_PARUN
MAERITEKISISEMPNWNCCSDTSNENISTSTNRSVRRKAFAHSKSKNERISSTSNDFEMSSVKSGSFFSRLLPHTRSFSRKDSTRKSKVKRTVSAGNHSIYIGKDDKSNVLFVEKAPFIRELSNPSKDINSLEKFSKQDASEQITDESFEEYKTSLETIMKFLRGDNVEKLHTPIASSVRTLKAQTIAPGGIEMILASMDDTFELHSALITSTDEQVSDIAMNENNENDFESTSNSEQNWRNISTFDSYLPLRQHGRTSSISSAYEKCSCDLRCILEENYPDIHDDRKENEIPLQQIKHLQSSESDKTTRISNSVMDDAIEQKIGSSANSNEDKTHHRINSTRANDDKILADPDEYPMSYIHKSGPSRHTIYSFVELLKLPSDYSFYQPISIMFDKNSGKLTQVCAKNLIEVCC